MVRRHGPAATRAAWMIYGGGRDSQPFPDLPTVASFPETTLNARSARATSGDPIVLPTSGPMAPRRAVIGQMYNQLATVSLAAEVDALYFAPDVTPLRP
jgi:hypothetical protein